MLTMQGLRIQSVSDVAGLSLQLCVIQLTLALECGVMFVGGSFLI